MPLTPRSLLLPIVALVMGALLNLVAASQIAGTLAFPLDDGWIHQTYARTLAESGEWAFRAGEPSSGSTAPLWTLLLVPGHWLPISPVIWSYLLGLLSVAATVLLGGVLSGLLFEDRSVVWWSMLAIGAEWHLGWAAVSGMEIGLYSTLVLLLLTLYVARAGQPWLWGLVGGALTLTRPEGVLLLGLLAVHWLYEGRSQPSEVLRGLLTMGLTWLLLVAPVLLFNWQVSGLLFPNTFYAKQQEYALILASVPLWQRMGTLTWQPWLGGQFLFLLALPWLPWRRLRLFQWLPLIWALGIVLLYALRLPVSYQHGRYLMPTIPIFLIYGVAAFIYALRRVPEMLRRPVAASVITGFLLFLLLGALAYGEDVAIIECEMGESARWVAEHSEPDDLIAAHDIGRLGYVAERPILDFAGLISPEVIPIIRNENALLDLAQQRGARYLVTFADWYPEMVKDERLLARHTTACPITQRAGVAPMTVYEIAPLR